MQSLRCTSYIARFRVLLVLRRSARRGLAAFDRIESTPGNSQRHDGYRDAKTDGDAKWQNHRQIGVEQIPKVLQLATYARIEEDGAAADRHAF